MFLCQSSDRHKWSTLNFPVNNRVEKQPADQTVKKMGQSGLCLNSQRFLTFVSMRAAWLEGPRRFALYQFDSALSSIVGLCRIRGI